MAFTTRYASTTGTGTYAQSTSNLTPCSFATAFGASAKAGDWFKLKAGTYSQTTTFDSLSGGGSSTSPLVYEGCDASWGSLTPTRANGGTGALDTSAFPVISYTSGRMSTAGSTIFLHLAFSGATATNALLALSTNCVIRQCSITNTSTSPGHCVSTSGTDVSILDCDISQTGASGTNFGISSANVDLRIIGCRIRVVSGNGINSTAGTGQTICGNTIYKCGTYGINTGGTGVRHCIFGNTVVGCGSDGINIITGNTSVIQIVGNILTDNGGYGINGVSADNDPISAYNRLDRNTLGAYNSATDWLAATKWNDNTTSVLQAAEFTDYTNNDFRLVATSPAIANGLWGNDMGALDYTATPPVGTAKIIQGYTY